MKKCIYRNIEINNKVFDRFMHKTETLTRFDKREAVARETGFAVGLTRVFVLIISVADVSSCREMPKIVFFFFPF